MTNFDYLLEEPQFKDFVQIAIAAEKVAVIDPATSVIDCRRAMELAVKQIRRMQGITTKAIIE